MKLGFIAWLVGLCIALGPYSKAEISVISCQQAKGLIENPDPKQRPVVIDTRGGYKDYFRSHLPTAHHLNFDTLRGTDHGVPVQYLPEDLTKALLIRAGIDRSRTHVSVGALLGMGASTRQAKWKKVQEIILAWITTVPIAAMLASLVYLILSWIPN